MQENDLVTRLLEKYKQFNYWLLVVPMIAMVAMFLLDAVNVATIRLFGFRATPGQKELIEELLIVVAYAGLAYVLLVPGHIKTDMVKNRLRGRLRFVADIAGDAAILFVAVFCTWTTMGGTIHNITFGSRKQGEIEFSLIPFFVLITLSFALLAFAALLVMIKHIQNFK